MKRILSLCLALLLAAGYAGAQQKNKAYLVSNAHFDSQWNWDVQRSISDYILKTLDQNLFLLGKYPNYVFNFEGGIKYQWMKEYYPHQYELIKKYIDEGRWHVTGSTWDANDPNIPSTESFTRNILYGQHFYRDEFGVEGTDIFLPDCFGFGWTLPTVAAHSGLIGFSTQKLQWRHRPFHGDSKIPFEIGLWEGVDGSRIMAVMDAHNYTTKWRYEDLSESRYLRSLTDRSPIKTVYHYYGTGDTGGAPTIESVRALELSLQGNGPVEIISATSDRMFKDYLPFDSHPELPVWSSELLMDVHATGCYTSQAAMKLYNRRNELLADAAERSAVAADWLGAVPYPKYMLTEAWKRFLWHQFHDDLTGTSIPRAYEFSWNDELISMKQFANVLETSVGAVSRALDTDVKGTPLVIYNPVGFPVSDIVEIDLPGGSQNIAVYDDKGTKVPHQITRNTAGEAKLLIRASVPAVGYAVYDIRKGSAGKIAQGAAAAGNVLENSVYRVTLDANGDISSIYDKNNGRELVKEGKSIRLALFTENESFSWPAWEITKKTIDAAPVAITGNVNITVVENGPIRSSVCVERTHEGSTFRQYIRLTEGGQPDRIDIYNEIDWQSTNALLKAEFPLNVTNEMAVYDLGVGSIARGNNTETAYEVYAQQWADLSDADGSYGVSVLNDSKYGWDKPDDNTIRLTLLHTPATRGGYAYQNRQDMGNHVFTYSIMGHESDCRVPTVHKAEVLNQPLVAFVAPKHKGTLGRSFSFISLDNDNVVLRALKQAEKSDEYVVRFYEVTGKEPQQVAITFGADIVSVQELNGVEDVIADAEHNGGRLEFTVKPYGMKTFKVKLAAPATTLSLPESVPVELPYNLKTASYNSFRSDANFDGKGNSYAAELLPESIDFKGIRFTIGSADAENAVKSRGDTILLPEGNFNKLYILAASTQHDNNAVFTVDGREHEVLVPYYSGFVGQWGHTGHTEGYVKPADIAFVGTHKHNMIQNRDVPYEFTYMFCVGIDIPAGARQLILPENSRIVVFAATVVNDVNNAAAPAGDLLRIALPVKGADEGELVMKNLVYGKPVIERSGEVNRSERAENALDEEVTTKWCDYSAARPKFIAVDMEAQNEVRGWYVMHAGLEALDYITKEYSLQVKTEAGDEWTTVDTVYDNTALETERLLPEPVKARYVRLLVTKPDQSEGNTVRIYEFAVY
ncbi:MAG: discoidin domain-containing protein [Alistipes sp.]|nr:discoidin domain-containing protein [Alistipes sp.]